MVAVASRQARRNRSRASSASPAFPSSSRVRDDLSLMAGHLRQYRTHLELLFGVVEE